MKNHDPLISAILPVYNGASYLKAALDSVARQAYGRMELIVVDDGSSDDSARIVHDWAETAPLPVRYVYQENKGPAAARNHGLYLANGEIIAFQDADDIWTDIKLTKQLSLMHSDPSVDVVLGMIQFISRSPQGTWEPSPGKWSTPGFAPVLQAALFRRSVFDKIGLLNEELRISEDVEWYLRLLEEDGDLLIHQDLVLYYRRHEANLTASPQTNSGILLRVLKKSIDRRRAKGLSMNKEAQ